MKLHFSTRYVLLVAALSVVLTLTLGATGTVAAQETTPEPENVSVDVSVGGSGVEECTERITARLSICSATFEDGTATLVFDSVGVQRLTLTDAGAFVEGGQVNRQYISVYDGRNTVEFSATKVSGFAGVAIDTGGILYAKKITDIQTTGPAISYQNVQGLVALTALSAAAFTFRTVKRRREAENKEVERIL